MIVRHAWVLVALALLAVPVAIHLLVRAPAQTVDLPSLRFVRRSRMRALRRRLIEDAGLLAVRALVLAAAVIALADPLLVTACRRSAWDAAIHKAVVLHEVAPEALAARQALAGSVASVSSAHLADGLWHAQTLLAGAGPGRRQIVVVSRFAAGSIDADVVRAVPDEVGLQFVRDEPAPPAEVPVDGPVWTSAGGTVPLSLTLGPTTTRIVPGAAAAAALDVVEAGGAVELPAFGVRIEHAFAPADRVPPGRAARAAVEAVLATGTAVPAADGERRRRPLVFRIGGQGGPIDAPATWMRTIVRAMLQDPELAAGAAAATAVGGPRGTARVLFRDRNGAPLVSVSTRAGQPPSLVFDLHADPTAPILPLVVQRLLAARTPMLSVASDPLTIADAQLAAWSRPAKPVPVGDLPDDWSDRRSAWTLVIVLLAIEWWWRRRSRASRPDATDVRGGEHAA